jgi:hypothetical protein
MFCESIMTCTYRLFLKRRIISNYLKMSEENRQGVGEPDISGYGGRLLAW